GDASGVLWALGLDGSERWSARLDGAIRGGAASDGQMVYAVSEQGEAAAFLIDGFEMWRRRIDHTTADASGGGSNVVLPTTVFASPTVTADHLLVSFIVDGGPVTPAVVALDRFVGTVAWRSSDPDRLSDGFANSRSSTARFGDTLVLASSLSDGIQGIESASGRARWMTPAGIRCERQWASPVVVSDLVLLPRPDGALHAYRAEDGETVWRIALAGPSEVASLAQCDSTGQQIQEGFELQASIAVAPDGTIIVASTSQLIFAIGGF
ncbi:MAG: PQQ-binding-like beta-propeller repeat protein, partial [bacterium]|nr:PQQ-binding-like beta-propeller repeat protein [bacterium]